MATSCEEVWASDSILLCFDGHVLEAFGFVDTHRFHIAMGLEIEVSEGRSTKCKIKVKVGHSLTIYCDSDRVDDLRAFAKVVTPASG